VHLDPLALGFAILSIGGLAALAAAISAFRRSGNVVARRLGELDVDPLAALRPRLDELHEQRPGLLGRLIAPIARLARPAKQEEIGHLRERLAHAGLQADHAASAFLAAKLVLAVGLLAFFLGFNAQRADPVEPAFVVAFVAFAGGYYLPDLWLSSRTRKRQTAIERGLPDALDLLVTCVEAGLGLDASLQRVSDEVRLAWPEVSGELQTTFLEVKAGIPRIEAFRRMAARTGVRDLKSLSATLTQTEIFGTSVALALRIQAEGIRVRRMHRAEEKAAYVGVKMTLPLILCILPSLMLVVVGPAALNIAHTLMPALRGHH
jgi:tight adherence protein C